MTKISSKGQVVIPLEMRSDLHEGDRLIVIRNGDQIILKKTDNLDRNFQEDIAFAKKTDEAWKRYDKGEFIEMDFDEFMKKAKKW